MGFLQDLYKDEFIGLEGFGLNESKEYKKLQTTKEEIVEKLKEDLSEDQFDLIDEVLEIENQIINIELFRMFKYSFRLAYSATIDILNDFK